MASEGPSHGIRGHDAGAGGPLGTSRRFLKLFQASFRTRSRTRRSIDFAKMINVDGDHDWRDVTYSRDV